MTVDRTRAASRLALAVTLVACGVIGGSIAFAGSGAPDHSFWSDQRPVVASVHDDLRNGFDVFARPRRSADEMSVQAREQVGNSVRSGRNVALSRAIATPTGTGWAVPGTGAICVVVPDRIDGYGVTCSETKDALTRGAVAMLIAPNAPETVQFTMITPRDSSVEAVKADGRIEVLDADVDGVVSATLIGAREVRVRTPTGRSSLTMPSPPPRSSLREQ